MENKQQKKSQKAPFTVTTVKSMLEQFMPLREPEHWKPELERFKA